MDKEKEYLQKTLVDSAPDVLSQIKSSHRFAVPEKPRRAPFFEFLKPRSLAFIAPIIVVALLLFTALNTQPNQDVIASTVTLDINPSIQITLDENDHVINVTAINDDGEAIIDRDIKYKGITLEQALAYLLDAAKDKGYIKETDDLGDPFENVILIEVDSDDETIKTRVDALVEAKVNYQMNQMQVMSRILRNNQDQLTDEQINQLQNLAQQYRMSTAKLRLIQVITTLDDTYTVADLRLLTIRELDQIRDGLLNPEDDTSHPCNNCQ